MIVVDGRAPTGYLRRLGTPPGQFAGVVITGIGLFMLGVLVMGAVATATGDEPGPSRVVDALSVSALCLVAVLVGARLLRGRCHLVLFLRRFGFTPATSVASHTVSSVVGRKWRVVTLEDAQVEPVTPKVWPSLTLFGLALGALPVVIFGPRALLSDERDADGGGDVVGNVIAGIVLWMLSIVVLWVLAIAIVLAAVHATLAFRASHDKRHVVERPEQLARDVRRITRRARRTVAPTLSVVKVVDELWRDAVTQLTEPSSVVVVDVSEPSDSLIWEIEMLARAGAATLFIADASRIATLVPADGSDGDAAVRQQLRQLVDGREVLVYRADDRRDMRRFHRLFLHHCELRAPSRTRRVVRGAIAWARDARDETADARDPSLDD